MEIKGEDFLKKVQKKQETEELEQRLSQLKGEEESIQPNSQQYSAVKRSMQDDDAVKVDIADQELGDIMLNGSTASSESNETNKRKYLILGLVLIILFLLTIVIIRLLNSPDNQEDSFNNQDETVQEEKSLENDSIEQQYQKIIDEKLKNIKEQTNQTQEQAVDENELNIDSIEQKEKKVEEKKAKPDVFGIKPKQEEVKKEVVKEVKKPVVKKEVSKKEPLKQPVKKVTTSSKPKGTFVQVGAFSKQPAKKYLQKIEANGFNYTIYKVTVNGKVYNKVLIGPYKNRASAEQNMSIIKRKLNISSAFILRF
ncbi:hypothetical protein CP960_05590 [Malaciobacter halophilus]|uniref:SPOR domain-containing protein n=1 Tax=Malaciobacter halophilus TaxID=197482 RepID=A0A2N1J3A8_9BACT|nr:SPOR domain-containing protein [Malaciobacter halophilus]AXH09175.1 SPOR domain-containing protein [Malaciobacter halophilus]PKI81031.1 hypothetical protein CP960_05590 [Malaciobacter halophilus]